MNYQPLTDEERSAFEAHEKRLRPLVEWLDTTLMHLLRGSDYNAGAVYNTDPSNPCVGFIFWKDYKRHFIGFDLQLVERRDGATVRRIFLRERDAALATTGSVKFFAD